LLSWIILLCGMFIGWTIGANDAANCMGTSVGAGIIDHKKATIIVGLLALMGAALQGGATTSTVGNGIIDASLITQVDIIIAMLAAAFVATVFTLFGLPVSTTQAVVGSIMGIGLVLGANVNWATVLKIFFAGFATPVIALVVAFFIYSLLLRLIPKIKLGSLDKVMALVVIGSGAVLSYTLGANNVGNAMGLVVEKKVLALGAAGFVGGVAIAAGATMLGWKVMRTVSTGITELNTHMALAAQAGAAAAVYLLTLMAIPTSTTFGIIGGIAGVGLVKGVASVDTATLKRIAIGWVMTPVFAVALTWLTKYVLSLF